MEERHDVAKQHPDIVVQLAAKLATFKAYVLERCMLYILYTRDILSTHGHTLYTL
jgi:hypothetical protein